MDLTLVPFGYSVSQGHLVDVHQVVSGKQCGCECPSCRAPLIARKGKKKAWHFAHDSQSRPQNSIEKCQFSFYVSVRMMARQLIRNSLTIRLPKCEVTLSEIAPLSGVYVQVSEPVTESREIVLTDVSVDTTLGAYKVDLSGFVNDYCLAIVFTHPGREGFDHFAQLDEKKTGVIAISLTSLSTHFMDFEAPRGSYQDIVENYISNDLPSKSWIFHPRLRTAEQKARSKLAEELVTAERQRKKRSTQLRRHLEFDASVFDRNASRLQNERTGQRFEFSCRMCNATWSGTGNSDDSCQKCGAPFLLVSSQKVPASED